MSHDENRAGDRLQRDIEEAGFSAAVSNEVALYRNTGDARFLWRAVMLHNDAARPLPVELVAKLAEWGSKVQTLAAPDAIAQALELRGSKKDKIGPRHAITYRRRWRLASEVDLVHRLRPDKSLTEAMKTVARNRGKSFAVVKKAYHDIFTAPVRAHCASASVQDLLQAWR